MSDEPAASRSTPLASRSTPLASPSAPLASPVMRRGEQRRGLPLARLLPNMLTLIALCGGLTAIRFALHGQWEAAVTAIGIAALFDMLDGRVARLLRLTSKFGAELDSLSDLVSFGVAPAFLLYQWVLSQNEQVGWPAVLAFVICAALRLARFNTMLEETDQPAWHKNFFVGLPTPGAAALALLPMIWQFTLAEPVQFEPSLIALWLLLLAAAMVSRLPILSLKGQRVPRHWVVPLFVLMAVIIAQLVTNPWRSLTWLGGLYLLAVPYGCYLYRRYQQRDSL